MVSKQSFIVFFFLVLVQMSVFGMGKHAEPFTKKVLNNFTVEELKQANFYLNDNLTLTRVVPGGETRGVDGGTLSIVGGERIETIVISKDVIGRLVSVNKNRVIISFSPNHTDRTLLFSEKLVGSDYVLDTRRSSLKYGQFEYKVNKEPKLLVKFTEEFIQEKTIERETGY